MTTHGTYPCKNVMQKDNVYFIDKTDKKVSTCITHPENKHVRQINTSSLHTILEIFFSEGCSHKPDVLERTSP